jgi:hypothetical protein
MPNYRVSLGFSEVSDAALVDVAGRVATGLTGNASFPNPPLAVADLRAVQAAFEEALARSALGGKQTTAEKNQVRTQVVDALRRLAAYVQMQMANDLAKLLSSGFEPVSGRSPSEPLPAPAILRIASPETTRMALKVTPIPNARAYEVRRMNGTGGWVPASIGTKSRRLEVDGLVPGSVYQFQMRAIGGSTGTGPWSDPVQHMAM